jgi:hypothetical protein
VARIARIAPRIALVLLSYCSRIAPHVLLDPGFEWVMVLHFWEDSIGGEMMEVVSLAGASGWYDRPWRGQAQGCADRIPCLALGVPFPEGSTITPSDPGWTLLHQGDPNSRTIEDNRSPLGHGWRMAVLLRD